MDEFPVITMRLVLDLVAVCQGCCCGNTANGRPAVSVEWLKKEWRARGLLKRIQLDLAAGAARADLLKAMDGHVIGKASYFGIFGR